ncbi:MAG: PAS domain-containing sensor histidine kinase [Bacteroidetes bacterium]|nr:PAS domain-containing sensor histidine kinase [Bacteroidota bacterium]
MSKTPIGEMKLSRNTEPADIVRQKIHEDISENEQRYRDLVEHVPLCIGVICEGRVVFINQSGARMMAAEKPEDIIGKTVIDFIHPDFRQLVATRLTKVLMGEQALPMEEKFVRLDGKTIHVEVSAYPFRYQGKAASQVIVRDITVEKESRMAARKSETLFSQLFHVSPMAIVMLDTEGNVAQVNPGFEKMFGYSFAELVGKGLNQTIVPDALMSEGNDLNTLISTQQVVRIETKRKRKDGALLSVIVYGLPVHYEDKTIGIFGVYVDITEQKKIEEELKVRNIELDNFVYKVSHDLRAPLSSVLGLVNLAQMPNNHDNPIEYLSVIGQKVGQLDHFITDVLSHSKNLKLDIKIEPINFKNLIEQTFTDLSYLKGAEQIKRNVSIDGVPFFNDKWRIGEIFRNLISNAIKYRNFHRVDPEINLRINIDEDKAVIAFSDNGIGIDPASLGKIFNMFYRASEQSDGSGLGLYIVKNAIEKLGGQVQVRSKIGEGTSFIITLPNHAEE